MLRSFQRTARASGFRRLPSHSGQGSSTSSHSIQESSTWSSVPVLERSASQPTSFSSSPVPTQAAHQPWRELYEKSRGSSSANARPHEGHERLVEKDCAVLPRTWICPLPISNAFEISFRNSCSFFISTAQVETGNSILCSLKRSIRGNGWTGTSLPSMRRC